MKQVELNEITDRDKAIAENILRNKIVKALSKPPQEGKIRLQGDINSIVECIEDGTMYLVSEDIK